MTCAIQVRPGYELKFAKALGDRAYCPPRRVTWINRGKKHEQDRSVLTGYVLADIDPRDAYDWHEAAAIEGFGRFLTGAPIPTKQIDAFGAQIGPDGYYVEPQAEQPALYKPGQKLRITKGSLAGQVVVCQKQTEPEKILVEAYLLGGLIRLYMPSAWCEPTALVDEQAATQSALHHQHKRGRRGGRFSRRVSVTKNFETLTI